MAPRPKPVRVQDIQAQLAALETKVNQQQVQHIIEVNARIHSELMQGYQRAASNFVNAQTDEWAFKASFLHSTLLLASREYDAILKLEDPKPFVGNLILSLVLVVVPHLPNVKDAVTRWKATVEDWKNTGNKLYNLALYVENDLKDHAGAAKDAIKDVRDGLADQKSKADQKTLDTAGAVMAREMGEMSKQLALAILTKRLLMAYIAEKRSPNIAAEVVAKWTKAGLLISHDFSGKVALKEGNFLLQAAQRLVYDLVRDYAQRYCKFVIDEADGRRYPMASTVKKREDVRQYEQAYLIGRFEGMSEATRNEIYKRYGAKWADADKDRPAIRDYRDMVTVWKIPLSKRPARKSAGSVDEIMGRELAIP
jgi:hypothetical protein